MMDRGMLAHSACHGKRSLISSVPHAVLDDKMATAAVLAVLMRKPDTTNFIYCHRAARSVTRNNPLQPWERETAAHLQPQRCTGVLLL